MINNQSTKQTKQELINRISKIVEDVKPFIRTEFIKSLRYKNKKELIILASRIKPDKDGYGILL